MSSEFDTGQATRLFLASLERLASPPEVQIAYLEGIGAGGLADELALEFDDLYGRFRSDAERMAGTSVMLAELARLSQQLDSMSGEQNGHLWKYNALYSSDKWRSVRSIAGKALAAWEPR